MAIETHRWWINELVVVYARASTEQQDLTSQCNGLHALGVGDDRIYVGQGMTGTNRDRPGLRRSASPGPRAGGRAEQHVLSVINTMLACCDFLDVIAAYLNGRPDHQRATQNAGLGGASAQFLPQRICAMMTEMSYFRDHRRASSARYHAAGGKARSREGDIAHLVGHANTRTTEKVYRKELRPC